MEELWSVEFFKWAKERGKALSQGNREGQEEGRFGKAGGFIMRN